MALTPYPSLATLPEIVRAGGKVPNAYLNPSWISLKYDVGIPDDATITGVGSATSTNSGYGTSTLTSGPYSGQTVTAAIQATLDRAATGPLGLLWDVRCAIGTPAVPGFSGDELLSALKLRRPGNLHIKGIPGCGAILRAQCNATMFANELPTFGSAVSGAGTDQQVNSISGIAFGNVIIEDLYLNANSGTIASLAAAPNQLNPTFGQTYYLNLFRLFGVQDVTFRGCTFVGQAGFGVYLGNWQRIRFYDGTIDALGAGGTTGGNDCFHLSGPGDDFISDRVFVSCQDDHYAFNTADGNNWSGRNHGAGGVGTVPAWGSLANIRAYRTSTNREIQGNLVKLTSCGGCSIDGVAFDGISGSTYQLAFLANSTVSGATAGPIGTIDFRNLDIDWSGSGIVPNAFLAPASIRRVSVRGVRRTGPNLSKPIVEVNAGGLDQLDMADVCVSDDGSSGSGLAQVIIDSGATVKRLSVAGFDLAGNAGSIVMPILQVNSGGTVTSALISGGRSLNVAAMVANAGTITNLVASGNDPTATVSGTAPAAHSGDSYH